MKCLIQHKELTSAGLEMVIKLTFSLAEESIKASIPELLESASLVYEDEINKQITNLIPIDKAAVESQFMHTAKYSNCVILPKMKSEIRPRPYQLVSSL